MINKIKKYREKRLISKYKKQGLLLGTSLSYSYMGKWVGFEKDIKKFVLLEEKIYKLGYHPIDLNKFIKKGGWGTDVNLDLLKIKNQEKAKSTLNINKVIILECVNLTQMNLANKISKL